MNSARWLVSLLVAIVLWASLAGCATTRAYVASMDDYTGKPVADLTTRLGPPSHITRLSDGGQVYSYERHDTAAEAGTRNTASNRVSCQTNFIINSDNIVRGWTLSGYDCRKK